MDNGGRRDWDTVSPDHRSPHNRRPYSGGRQDGNFRQKRQRNFTSPAAQPAPVDPEQEKDAERKRLIVSIGDLQLAGTREKLALNEVIDDLHGLSMALHAEMDQHKEKILTLIITCATQLPTKQAIYASLCALLNDKDPEIGRELVMRIRDKLLESIKALAARDYGKDGSDTELKAEADEQWQDRGGQSPAFLLRMTLKFIGQLTNVGLVSAECYLKLLTQLQQNYGSHYKRERHILGQLSASDFFAWTLMECIVVTGKRLEAEDDAGLSRFLSSLEEYMNERWNGKNGDALKTEEKLLQLWVHEMEDFVPEPSVSMLSCFWKSVQSLQARAEKWHMASLIEPQTLIAEVIHKTTPHSLEDLELPSETVTECGYMRMDERLFDDESGAAGSAVAAIPTPERLWARTLIVDTVQAFHPNTEVTGTQLLHLTAFLKTALSSHSKNGSSPPSRKAAVPAEYFVVEILLLELLRLPHALPNEMCLVSVLVMMVKKNNALFSPAIAVVIELLYRSIPQMDSGVASRLAQVFSLLLSNFEFKWPWQLWVDVMEEQEDDPQRIFVSSSLERCVRLAYLERIQKALPKEFVQLLPPPPQPVRVATDEQAVDPNDQMGLRLNRAANLLLERLKKRDSADTICVWIAKQISERVEGSEDEHRELWAGIAIECILLAGSTSYSHIRLMLDRYAVVVAAYNKTEVQQHSIVRSLADVWRNSPQSVAIILDMLLRRRLVRPSAVAKWVFGADMGPHYQWPYCWEALDSIFQFCLFSQRLEGETRAQLEEELFRCLFQGVKFILGEYEAAGEAKDEIYGEQWVMALADRLKDILRKYHFAALRYRDGLESLRSPGVPDEIVTVADLFLNIGQ